MLRTAEVRLGFEVEISIPENKIILVNFETEKVGKNFQLFRFFLFFCLFCK